MNAVLRPLNTALGAATAAAVCAGLLTVPAHQAAPQVVVREVPVVLQALTINDIVTRVSDAITYGFAVAPVWYLGLPISIPMSIGIGFGLADLIPVVGDAFGFTWTLDQVGRTLVGIGLSALVYAVGPPHVLAHPVTAQSPHRHATPRQARRHLRPTGSTAPPPRRRLHRPVLQRGRSPRVPRRSRLPPQAAHCPSVRRAESHRCPRQDSNLRHRL